MRWEGEGGEERGSERRAMGGRGKSGLQEGGGGVWDVWSDEF